MLMAAPKRSVSKREVSRRLKKLRDARGMKNADLAKFLGVTPRALLSYLYTDASVPGCILRMLEHAEAGRI